MSSATGGLPEFSPMNGTNGNQASSAETPQSQKPQADPSADQGSLLPPPRRPVRPIKPEPAVPAVVKQPRPQESFNPDKITSDLPAQPQSPKAPVETGSSKAVAESVVLPRQHPISTPSEPRQYRAIGLVRGCYVPSEEQFNLGVVKTDTGEEIDSVLLGRVTSLIKNHIDLAVSHLWVVYPRTREQSRGSLECDLHLQIVGVWEPETLNQGDTTAESGQPDEEIPTAAESVAVDPDAENDNPESEAIPTTELPDNYFSIRGEILRYSEDTGHIVVNIVQVPKQSGKPPKSFRLTVKGVLEGTAKTVGYFWDLNVQRQGSALVLESGTAIGIVPPKKRKPGERGKARRPVKRFKSNRGSDDRPRDPNRSSAERPVISGDRRKPRREDPRSRDND